MTHEAYSLSHHLMPPSGLASGTGSELYRGIGSVVLSGFMLSTMFTLLLVPAIFSLMMGWKRRGRTAPSGAVLGPEIRET